VGAESRDRRRERRADDDVPLLHPVAADGVVEPDVVELAPPLVCEQNLGKGIAISPPQVPEIRDAQEAGGPHRIGSVEQPIVRIGSERDPPAPAAIQEFGPRDLLRPLADDLGVVAHRVEVEEVRHAGAEAWLGAGGFPGCVCPLHNEPAELRGRPACASPSARSIRVEAEDAKRCRSFRGRAAAIAGPHLPELEQRVDLVPAHDPRNLDRLEAAVTPERADEMRETGVDVVDARRLPRPALERR
jgi:hypothetical protein